MRLARTIVLGFAGILACLTPASAGPVLLYDTEGDRVLYAEDADQPWYAASLTKMMTAYLVFEAWKTGRATKEAKITISEKANAQPKMRLGLGKGKELSYEDALKALIIVSANDIAYALAEAVSGDMETFVAAMNAKAAELGLSGTRFINPHGLPGRGQHTTAQDMARLAAALMRDYPEHLPYFGITTTEIGDKRKRTIGTHNPVLVTFEGGDGFKTGYTCSAGYNIVASASREGRRLVVVLLGEESSAKRAVKMRAMLDYGFKMMAWKAMFPAATIHSLPGGLYDREKVRQANLEQRFRDCRDADPEEAIAFEVAHAAAIAGAAALGGVPAADPIVTGSVTPPAAPSAPTKKVPAATPPVAAAPAPAPKSASPVKTVPTVAPAVAALPAPTAAAAPAPKSTTGAATIPAAPAAKPATATPAVAPTAPAVTPSAPAAKPAAKAAAKRKAKPAAKPADGVPFSLASP